ncbi:glycoside hydrolase family 27 protein [Turicibacter sanguinis]|uniref:glycoside hydrolase family 27 protein n=1 Tax=Turicibacter sanguinis TaxID=154288 RepID=UPI0006C6AFB4|nr:glycoside hydrolase family 27 protein [Turicibacter sanguinis]CUM71176.1 Alpha-galactosidase A precursor [Turicibacter sanguinis]
MKGQVAKTPPMGWNSWDCYGASVTEEEVRANAEYMAMHLKSYGWEYVVVDIQWYEPEAYSSMYRPFADLVMDEYSRLWPAINRFPSATDGMGFKALGEYIHSLGLKFGIHIMRGIPRQAVHANTKILATDKRARDIASTNSICAWNTDMYGVDASKEGAQAYYNSLFDLYASWGVDFVKVDDCSKSFIGFTDYFADEIELIRHAIDQCGREIVLSLSPGPTPIEEAQHLKKHANMWRMTNDYWDCWEDLLFAFEKCHEWENHGGAGHWPDADMLPIGRIGVRSCERGRGDRQTLFTKDEQVSMLTLWCMFRSPLMLGCELRDSDEFTVSLMTNEEVLHVLNHSQGARQLYREDQKIAWMSCDDELGYYLALFNIGETEIIIRTDLKDLGLREEYIIRDLWTKKDLIKTSTSFECCISPHGSQFFKLTSK